MCPSKAGQLQDDMQKSCATHQSTVHVQVLVLKDRQCAKSKSSQLQNQRGEGWRRLSVSMKCASTFSCPTQRMAQTVGFSPHCPYWYHYRTRCDLECRSWHFNTALTIPLLASPPRLPNFAEILEEGTSIGVLMFITDAAMKKTIDWFSLWESYLILIGSSWPHVHGMPAEATFLRLIWILASMLGPFCTSMHMFGGRVFTVPSHLMSYSWRSLAKMIFTNLIV